MKIESRNKITYRYLSVLLVNGDINFSSFELRVAIR